MKAHDWFIEHRLDFVARALDPGDEDLFRDHMARCEECAAAVASAATDLRWLPMAAAPVTPRPGFSRRVMDEVVGPRKTVWSRWSWPLAAAAGIAAVLLGGLTFRQATQLAALRAERDSIVSVHRTELAAARDTLSLLQNAERVLTASIDMDGRRGGMLIFADETTHRWKVVVHGIPRAKDGMRYTFWFITGDGMVRGAVVECDETRPGVVMLDMPPGATLIRGGALTEEPMDGDPQVPRGKELAHLEL
ncbi:MAG TPA: anti-sigma factor [Gemmatimonadaceae bacterium]